MHSIFFFWNEIIPILYFYTEFSRDAKLFTFESFFFLRWEAIYSIVLFTKYVPFYDVTNGPVALLHDHRQTRHRPLPRDYRPPFAFLAAPSDCARSALSFSSRESEWRCDAIILVRPTDQLQCYKGVIIINSWLIAEFFFPHCNNHWLE